MKIVVIYVLHELNRNVEFFIKHGIISRPDTDYFIVINSKIVQINSDVATVINRDNIGHDFGGWSHCLFLDKEGMFIYDYYDYFIFINSTVRGPFLPEWSNENWIDVFILKINSYDKLVGTSIGFYKGLTHVQSMMFCTDRVGIDILVKGGIFSAIPKHLEKTDVVLLKEIGMSTKILEAGYNIACMLTSFKGIDFRVYKQIKDLNVFANDNYFGIEVHPYEVIFIKYPSTLHQSLIKTIEMLTEWKNNNLLSPKNEMNPSFNWKEYLKLNKDVFWVDNSEEFSKIHYLNHGIKEGRKFKGPLKHWEVYLTLNPDIMATHSNRLTVQSHYSSFGASEKRQTVITGFDPDKFNWIYYRNINVLPHVKTRLQAINHYINHGMKLKLKYQLQEPTKYYLIDLNPLSSSGLFNQMISLVNGIILGYSQNRHVVVSGFYPDYNSQNKIRLSDVVNLVHLNNLLKIEDINIKVLDQSEINVEWKKSEHLNPTKKQYLNGNPDWAFVKLAEDLFKEKGDYIDISDTFTFFLFRHNVDDWLSTLFVKLLIGIKYSDRILATVEQCKTMLQLKPAYSSIHLRLEDDFLFHRPDKSVSELAYGENIKNRYLSSIPNYFSKSEDIYLCTFLLKAPNQYNFFPGFLKSKYPGVKFWKKPEFYWRSHLNLPKGREIDALVDYLICLNSSKFLGYNGSTFSEVIKYYFDEMNKIAILI